MEIWFWAALAATALMGVANFSFKVAAKRGYGGAAFSLWGAVTTLPPIFLLAFLLTTTNGWAFLAVAAGVATGVLGATNNITKVAALRYIDTTIYFPLFKLLSPLIAIVFGVVLFSEQFTTIEWVGLGLSMLVPLMLITPSENGRQENLYKGLVFVFVTAVLAASGAALIKYATDVWPNIWWITAAQITGMLLGSVLVSLFNNREVLVNLFQPRNEKPGLIWWAFARSTLMGVAVLLVNYAYVAGGALAVVHTITSMYILIPIVLAIIFYNEHWNLQKVAAIVLSVGALALLG